MIDSGSAEAAAYVFALTAAGGAAFQVALALGAPWGAYAMGGAVNGPFPPVLRVAALFQAVILIILALIVLTRASVLVVPILRDLPWTIWVVVVFSGVSLVLNGLSRSAGERRLWTPVALAMVASSLIVALGPT